MTASPDPERLIRAFLDEGEEQLHDQVYDAVRAGIEQRRQRAFIGPWRTPNMNKFAAIGLAAAAVVAVLLIGATTLGPLSPAGLGTTESAAPSTAASSTGVPSPSASTGDLAVGSSYWLTDEGEVPVSVVIPAAGWFADDALVKNMSGGDPPDGAGLLAFGGSNYLTVPSDPCHWESHPDATVHRSFDETVARLEAQLSRDATPPVDVMVGGYRAKSLTLHVPADADFTGCFQHQFCTLTMPQFVALEDSCMRHAQGPGQIDELWIVDVNGWWIVIDAAYYQGTPPEHVDEMRAMVDSATFVAPTETPEP